MYITHKQDLVCSQFDINRTLFQLHLFIFWKTSISFFLSILEEKKKKKAPDKGDDRVGFGEHPFWSLEEASSCVLSLGYQALFNAQGIEPGLTPGKCSLMELQL